MGSVLSAADGTAKFGASLTATDSSGGMLTLDADVTITGI